MELLRAELESLVILLQGDFENAKREMPGLLRLITDTALGCSSLAYALRRKGILTEKDLEDALGDAYSEFTRLRVGMLDTMGTS